MRPSERELTARLAVADPALTLGADEAARAECWRRLMAAGAGTAQPPVPRGWPARLRARLRRPIVLLPAIAALAGGALAYQPALCDARARCGHGAATTASIVSRPAERPAARQQRATAESLDHRSRR